MFRRAVGIPALAVARDLTRFVARRRRQLRVISRRFLRVHATSGYPPKFTVNADIGGSVQN
jgi:hypothetical protein